MAEVSKCIVHTQGDPGDVLFVLPSRSRELHEGDVFTYTGSGGTIKYKVETVDYRVTEGPSPNPNTAGIYWREQEVYYGVSVVP